MGGGCLPHALQTINKDLRKVYGIAPHTRYPSSSYQHQPFNWRPIQQQKYTRSPKLKITTVEGYHTLDYPQLISQPTMLIILPCSITSPAYEALMQFAIYPLKRKGRASISPNATQCHNHPHLSFLIKRRFRHDQMGVYWLPTVALKFH